MLYNFKGSGDPGASLLNVNGRLYGTALLSDAGDGTVYRITTGGSENVLHVFGGKGDGTNPGSDLIDVNGTLYGTTQSGGAYDSGTVFSITTSGTEKVLHSFAYGTTDGNWPVAGLVDVGGTLYGTTRSGGADASCKALVPAGCGTVFSITTGGTEKVLHSFRENTGGYYPEAGLVEVSGTLYGTALAGGAFGNKKTTRGGVVFSITTSGKTKVLHSFGNGTDGDCPEAGLVDVHGTLYGTTRIGGAYGDGTVFSITTSGAEKVLHSFYGSDGSYPWANLIDVSGTLYGTTYFGGAYANGDGGGTAFSITTGGKEAVLHSFGKSKDGEGPKAGLIDVDGTLYGTTIGGGTYHTGSYGNGTVFALTP